MITDNGSCYKSQLWPHACAATGTTVKKTRPCRPQTNGKIERFHRILLEEWAYIRPWTSDHATHIAYAGFIHFYNHHRAQHLVWVKVWNGQVTSPLENCCVRSRERDCGLLQLSKLGRVSHPADDGGSVVVGRLDEHRTDEAAGFGVDEDGGATVEGCGLDVTR